MPVAFKRRHAFAVFHLRKNPTAAEHEFRCRLDALGLDYRFQRNFYHPFVRMADFFIPSLNLIVEIDARYHDAGTDRRKDEEFERVRGIRTLVSPTSKFAPPPRILYGLLCDRPVIRQFQCFEPLMKSTTDVFAMASAVPIPARLIWDTAVGLLDYAMLNAPGSLKSMEACRTSCRAMRK